MHRPPTRNERVTEHAGCEVVGVDLQSHDPGLRRIDVEVPANRGDGLGKQHTDAAVKDAKGLEVRLGNEHGGNELVFAHHVVGDAWVGERGPSEGARGVWDRVDMMS